MAKRKVSAPVIDRGVFLSEASVLKAFLNGTPISMEPREFVSGSVGWHVNGKMFVEVAGLSVKVQVNLSAVVIGTKSAPKPKPKPKPKP